MLRYHFCDDKRQTTGERDDRATGDNRTTEFNGIQTSPSSGTTTTTPSLPATTYRHPLSKAAMLKKVMTTKTTKMGPNDR